MVKSYSDHDFQRNQAIAMRLEVRTSAPAEHAEGRVYYDSVLKRVFFNVDENAGEYHHFANPEDAETIVKPWTFDRDDGGGSPFVIGANHQDWGTNRVDWLNAERVNGFATSTTATANSVAIRYTNGRLRVADPVEDLDSVNLRTLNAAVRNRDQKRSVKAATTQTLPAFTPDVGNPNRIIADANGAFPDIDNVVISVGEEFLYNVEGNTDAYFGLYTLDVKGDAGTPWEAVRREDADSDSEVTNGLTVFVSEGTVNQKNEFTLITPDPITLNTTPLEFTVTAGNSLYEAGNGLSLVGATFHFSGSTAYSVGQIFYASDSTTVSRLNPVTSGNALVANGASQAPSWGKIQLAGPSIHVTGTLGISQGGTNSSSALNNGRVMISSSGAIVEHSALTENELVVGDNSFGVATISISAAVGNQMLGLDASKTVHEYKDLRVTAAGTITKGAWNGTAIGLGYGGTNASLTASAGGVVYSTASALAISSPGSADQVLVSGGPGAPVFRPMTVDASGNVTFTGTATTENIVPDVDSVRDLGTTGTRWANAYIDKLFLTNPLGVTDGGTGTSTTFTAGSVVFAGSSGVYAQDNSNFFWDNINKRLAIGTANPGAKLHVKGSSKELRIESSSDSTTQFSGGGYRQIEITVTGSSTNNWGGISFNDSTDGPSATAIQTLYTDHANNYGELHLSTRDAGGIATRLMVSSAGNVYMGKTSGTYKLDVAGDINIDAGQVYRVNGNQIDTDDVLEGANLYYTDARARASLSGTAGHISYNSSTGVIDVGSTVALTDVANLFTTEQTIEGSAADSTLLTLVNSAAASTSNVTRFQFKLKSDTQTRQSLQINTGWSDITDATRTSITQFVGVENGVFNTALELDGFNVNVPNGEIQLGGTSINTAGTLSNVAYLNQAQTFTAKQTIFKGDSGLVGTPGFSSTALVLEGNGNVDLLLLSPNTSTANYLYFGDPDDQDVGGVGYAHNLDKMLLRVGATTGAEIWTTGVNTTGTYHISGTSINTAGTLSNVAYLNQAQTFTAKQTISSGGLDVTGTTSLRGAVDIFDSGVNVVTLGNDANGSIELGKTNGTSSNPFIDFHSSLTPVDYDARIRVLPGNGAVGGGPMEITGSYVDLAPAASRSAMALRFREDQVNGSSYVALRAAASLAGSVTWTLPSSDASGVWKSDGAGNLSIGTLLASNGGTGHTTYSQGDILYAATTTSLNRLAIGTDGQFLSIGSGTPFWATLTAGKISAGTFKAGNFTFQGDVLPEATGSRDLGGASFRWEQLHVNQIGLGISPTAKLHIAGGSTSANSAPLKLGTGSLMTTPEVGAFEFSTGNNLYFTRATSVRRRVAMFYSQNIGNASSLSFTVTHNLNNTDVIIQVYEAGGNKEYAFVDREVVDANSVRIVFKNYTPATNEFNVRVCG